MDSNLLTVIALIISIIGLGLATFALWQIKSLNTLRKNFFAGRKGLDLEDVINAVLSELKDMHEEQVNLERNLLSLQQQLNFAIQKVGLVRFNPFGDSGGNFSFSLALLDAENTGIVITSMHGREQNRIYCKEIIKGASKIGLTEEELNALRQADSVAKKF